MPARKEPPRWVLKKEKAQPLSGCLLSLATKGTVPDIEREQPAGKEPGEITRQTALSGADGASGDTWPTGKFGPTAR